MRTLSAIATLALAAITLTPPACAQTPKAPLPSFDVISVRPFVPTGPWHRDARYDPQRLTIEGMSPMELIEEAYGVQTNQIADLPDWAYWVKNFFTVVGTTNSPATPDQMKLMLRRLLQDRFQLEMEDTTVAQRVYGLVIAPGGLKVPPLKDGESCSAANQARIKSETTGLQNYSVGNMGCTTADLLRLLNTQNSLKAIDLPVVDQTGLTGNYLLAVWREMGDLQPTPDGRGMKIGHMETLQDAMASELGLKLVKTTSPFRVLKVTHISQPTPD